MNIGYACLTLGVRDTNFKTCTLKNVNEENLIKIIRHNLKTLENIVDYNIENKVKLFRISSDIIPFGSSDVNTIAWWDMFKDEFEIIGDKIKKSNMRVSMHPGQYTVLNSNNPDVVKRAIEDLEYHTKFLDSLGVDKKNKIILHIGGVYGDKKSAIERFIKNYRLLDVKIKDRLVIENDDKSYNIEDVLEISEILNIPVVYDNLHNEILSADPSKSDIYYIEKARNTWGKEDGRQKTHYSQQNPEKRPGSHSVTIDIEEFSHYIDDLPDIDIMFEVKDKNLSTMKAINYLNSERHIKNLELEWSKYKYNILEHSPVIYGEIRNLLKEKDSYPILEFYALIDKALNIDVEIGNSLNAIEHVWGYFKDRAIEKEKKKYNSYLERYKKGNFSIKAVKKLLLKMAVKYNEEYLLSSYYFHF